MDDETRRTLPIDQARKASEDPPTRTTRESDGRSVTRISRLDEGRGNVRPVRKDAIPPIPPLIP
jgi:hypothetical protein